MKQQISNFSKQKPEWFNAFSPEKQEWFNAFIPKFDPSIINDVKNLSYEIMKYEIMKDKRTEKSSELFEKRIWQMKKWDKITVYNKYWEDTYEKWWNWLKKKYYHLDNNWKKKGLWGELEIYKDLILFLDESENKDNRKQSFKMTGYKIPTNK